MARTLEIAGFGLTRDDLPPLEIGRIDPRDWFEHSAQRFEIEIGTGKGTFLVQQAALQPDINFLGFESVGEFFRYSADRVRRRSLTNVKIVYADATEFLKFRCVDAVADVIHLYFSDPWPKTRHHKRRVVQDWTLVEVHRALKAYGELRLVTDHDDLWAWYLDHVTRHAHLFERREFEPLLSAGNGEMVGTNFERKYRREGRPFYAMTLVKLR